LLTISANDLFAVLGGKMGVAGIGSALSTQFDFTKMTNSGLLNAAQKLDNEGKISSGDEIQLVGIASGVDSYPTNGIASSVSNTLQDPTQKNFIAILTQDLKSATSEGMTKQANLDRSLLTDLNQYQAPANANTGGTLSTLA
jgi:hypothetical protein